MMKKCKIYKNKESQESTAPWDLTKKFSLGARIWQTFGNFPGGCWGGGSGKALN